MASFEVMYPDVRAAAAQAPDRLILRALRHAATELCFASHVWREALDPIPAESGVAVYDYGAPTGSRVEKVLSLKFKGRVIDYNARPREVAMLDSTVSGPPLSWANNPITQQFTVWPTPGVDDVGDFEAFVVLVPTDTATSLPDGIIQAYRQGIIAYAKAELLALAPSMPWYDPNNATMQRQLGDEVTARAKRDQLSGGHVQMRVQPRRFT